MPLKRRRSNSSELSTHASHPLTNETTLPDNSLTSKKRTRTVDELVSDTGSGLNFKRKGFKTLLDAVVDGLAEEVVVMHRDRLCRFGADLLDSIFAKTGTKLVVHCSPDGPEDDSRELADDLLAVTTVFVARHNGRRSADNRRRRSREARNKDCLTVLSSVIAARSFPRKKR
jgi:predicted site-specific integrase-resolvase